MNDKDFSNVEHFWPVPFRSPKLDVAGSVLALVVMGAVIAATPTAPSSLGLAIVIGFLVLGLFQHGIKQQHLLDLVDDRILRVTKIGKWTRVEQLETFENVAALVIKPSVNMWSKHQRWTNPIYVGTESGKEFALQNMNGLSDYDYAMKRARAFSGILECNVVTHGPEVPVEIVSRGERFGVRPKETDLGLLGRAVAVSACVGLVWGLISLMP